MGVSKKHFLTAVFQSRGLPSAVTPPGGNRTWFLLNLHRTEEPFVTVGVSAASAVQMVVLDPTLGFWNSREQWWMCRLAPLFRSLWEVESQFFWLALLPDRLPPTGQNIFSHPPDMSSVTRLNSALQNRIFFFFFNEDFELAFTGLIYIFKQHAETPGPSASNRRLHLSIHLISH